MSFKLYELTELYQNIWELVGDDDVDVESLETALKHIEDNIEVKAESIAKLIKGIDGDIAALKEEENRLTKRRKTLENKQVNIKSYLESQLRTMGIDKVKTPLFTISLQKNPPSVHISNEELIPDKYKKTQITTSVVKKDLLEDLKLGEIIDGAEIKQEKSLRIK